MAETRCGSAFRCASAACAGHVLEFPQPERNQSVTPGTLLLESMTYANQGLVGAFWSLGYFPYFRFPLSCVDELPSLLSDLDAVTPLPSSGSLSPRADVLRFSDANSWWPWLIRPNKY